MQKPMIHAGDPASNKGTQGQKRWASLKEEEKLCDRSRTTRTKVWEGIG